MTRRVALVTGAASGIGLATAQRLVEAGYDLALVDIDRSAIASACQRLKRTGSRVIGIPADIAREPDLDRAIRRVYEKFGSLQAVVANAGINGVWAPIDDIRAHEWDTTISCQSSRNLSDLEQNSPHVEEGRRRRDCHCFFY